MKTNYKNFSIGLVVVAMLTGCQTSPAASFPTNAPPATPVVNVSATIQNNESNDQVVFGWLATNALDYATPLTSTNWNWPATNQPASLVSQNGALLASNSMTNLPPNVLLSCFVTDGQGDYSTNNPMLFFTKTNNATSIPQTAVLSAK